MLQPIAPPPFNLQWGFSTRAESPFFMPSRLLSQVHGTRVLEASDQLQEGDGLWTMEPGRFIGVRVADCTPILLAGPIGERPWVAALHAGWRGAVGALGEPGILRNALRIFRNLGGKPWDLVWALGPALQACHFEVGEEVVEAARRDPAWREDLAKPGPRGRPHLDLAAFLKSQALDLGLDPAKDGSLSRCTRCEGDIFYSYRGGDLKERQWGWVRID